MELSVRRQKAWVGDAILSLFAREWILKEKGRMDGKLHTRLTSNEFLATVGNPTRVEAAIGLVYENEGLEAAFRWIEEEIMPAYHSQAKKTTRRRSRTRTRSKSEAEG